MFLLRLRPRFQVESDVSVSEKSRRKVKQSCQDVVLDNFDYLSLSYREPNFSCLVCQLINIRIPAHRSIPFALHIEVITDGPEANDSCTRFQSRVFTSN